MTRCPIIGVHEDGAASLSTFAQECLATADLVIGASHQLHAVAALLPEHTEQRVSNGRATTIATWVEEAFALGQQVVVLATGDPLYYGIAARLIDALGQDRVQVVPTLSSVQLAAARLGLPWQGAKLISAHAADSGEWTPSARHDHALAPLARALHRHDLLFCLTSPANSPARIARLLLAADLGEDFRLDVVTRLSAPDEALFTDLRPTAVAEQDFPTPNIVVLRRITPRPPRPSFGIEDAQYAQRQPERGLLTRLEVRAVSLAKLRLHPAALVWDIGAGSGTVGLEAALLCPDGHVYAIEKNAADSANARANARRFGILNYTLITDRAPAQLDTWPDPDAVFIGGSSGVLSELIEYCLARLKPGGRLVINLVTIENLASATAAAQASGQPWDLLQLSAARSQPILDLHRLAAQNPVWIVVLTKEPA